MSRVKIHGDTEDQKALDAAFFYLHSSLHPSCRTGMPPYGLTQFEALEGHVFWDMDSWCLPPALLASPASVRAMLEYRLRGLGRCPPAGRIVWLPRRPIPLGSRNPRL